MDTFSEIVSLNSVVSGGNKSLNNTEIKNMSRNNARRSTLRKWLKACKNTTKRILLKTFSFKSGAIEASLFHTHLNSTTETDVSSNNNKQHAPCNHQHTENGREINPSKMFASSNVDLLALARKNLKSESVKVYSGHVREKIEFFEKQITASSGHGCLKNDASINGKMVSRKENLQEKVRFFEEFGKTKCSITLGRPKATCRIIEESKDLNISKCKSTPAINFEDLIERDRTIWCLMKESHKQCYFMKQATDIIEACQRVKAFEYDLVHLEAEKLLLLSGLRRVMLLKRIRKLQFLDEYEISPRKGFRCVEISNLRFSISKEHKNRKLSFIAVCSTETDMHVSHLMKVKPQKGFVSIPGVHSFKELNEDSTMTIKVYQLHFGNCFGGQRMFQIINEKNTKFRRKLSIQYKDIDSETLIQDKVLEPLYKIYSSLEIDFSDCKNVRTNYSEECSLQGLLTLKQFEGRTTFRF